MSVATSGPLRTAASVVDLIGNTPLIRLTSFEAGLRNVELYAKAEWRNPGGSVKDPGGVGLDQGHRADAGAGPGGEAVEERGVRIGPRSGRKANDLAFRETNARSHSEGPRVIC